MEFNIYENSFSFKNYSELLSASYIFSNLTQRWLSTRKCLNLENDLSMLTNVKGAYLKYNLWFPFISSGRSRFVILSSFLA
jgi:hypothetical protein